MITMPFAKNIRDRNMLINFDVRCLQDQQFAQKGIGQHALYLLSLLRGIKNSTIVGVADPLLGRVQQEVGNIANLAVTWIDSISGDLYFSPSPLTHDTSPLIAARRRGMRTCAVVHDFIPFRVPAMPNDAARSAQYRYLVNTLTKYDALYPNSLYTASQLREYVPDFGGDSVTVHCKSRFPEIGSDIPLELQLGKIRPGTRKQIATELPYVFVATADDPRKNPEIAISAAVELNALGLSLVIGGGLSDQTKKRLAVSYPEQFILAKPVFLPRLTDAELHEVYLGASIVLVGSRDEGFSLPVAEALTLGCSVVASKIPAHLEQIKDPDLLFEPNDVRSLLHSVKHALRLRDESPHKSTQEYSYVHFDYTRERASFVESIIKCKRKAARHRYNKTTIVGPTPGRPTGIAVFNGLMVSHLKAHNFPFEYVDVDAFDADRFHVWLFEHQDDSIIYVIGNNNVFHTNCYSALMQVPGFCILHDSRLFEFLLNRHGADYIRDLWLQRMRSIPLSIETIVAWQRERRLLPDSFLDPVVTRATAIVVHSKIAAQHIVDVYRYTRAHYIPFALQMTEREVTFVKKMRASNTGAPPNMLSMVTLGETEPTKGCAEIIYALKMLLLQGIEARLTFVGKSDEPYHSELLTSCEILRLNDHVTFTSYVSRQGYLDSLIAADVVIQLRYPMFGQVSGPLADAVACGIPTVATEDLAIGMGIEGYCEVIENRFSPLHVAEAVRRIREGEARTLPRGALNSMNDYVTKLIATVESSAQVNGISR